MTTLNFLVNLIASLLGPALIGAPPAAVHVVAIFSVAVIAMGVAIVSPALFLGLLGLFLLLYLTGSIH